MHNSSDITGSENPDIDLHALQLAMKAAAIGVWKAELAFPEKMRLDEQCAALLGLPLQESTDYKTILSRIHEDDRSIFDAAFQYATSAPGDKQFDQVFRVISTSGEITGWVHFTGRSYPASPGRDACFTGTAMNVTEAEQARERATRVEALTGIALKGTGVGLFHIDLSGNKIDYSPAFAIIITGDNNRKRVREDFIDHIHQEDRALRSAAYEAALKSGDLYYEARTVWHDGTIHWIRTVGNYIYDDSGKATYFSGTVQDITGQKEREQALRAAEDRLTHTIRQSEAMFRNVTSTSPTGLWMSDPQGGLIYLNKTLTDWTGMPYESLLGHGWLSAVVRSDRPLATEVFREAIRNHAHYDVQLRIRKGTGEVVWCRVAGDPYYDDDGLYNGYVGFCMDIHEQVISADQLKVSEERIRSLISQAPVAIGLLHGRDMIVETANESILEIWGKDRTILGKPLSEALPEIRTQQFLQLLQDVYDTGIPYYGNSVMARLERKGIVQEAFFDFVYTPVRDAENSINGVMVIATEVTGQVLARKAVEESEARFRNLIQEAPVATCLFVGRSMQVQLANEKMLSVWGKDESVMGKPLKDAVPELQDQLFISLLENVFNSGIAYEAKGTAAKLEVNGSLDTYYFDFTYKPLRNAAGEVYAIMNMATDVTAQVMARKKLEESELFTRSIIEYSPIAKAVLVGEQLQIRTVNEKMLEMLGRDDSITGQSFMTAMPELIDTTLPENLLRVLHTGETFYQPEEKLQLMRFGQPHTGYYNYTYKALPDTSGRFYGIIITATEVTAQVLARQKIEEAEEALRGAVELAELGTWTLDVEKRLLSYSPRLRSWFGFSGDGPFTIEQGYASIREKDWPVIKTSMAHALDPSTDGVYDVEYTAIDRITGRERILHAQGKAFLNEQGQVYKITGTAQDVTEQRKIQLALSLQVQERTEELQAVNEELQAVNEELQATNEELYEANDRLTHSNEELAQYAYVASHDLQEPLRKIRMFSGMLFKDQSSAAFNKMLVGKISQSSERMTLLIRDLLEFSRLLKSETILRPVDLGDVCSAVSNDFELIIQEKNASVAIGPLPVIEAVGLQMNQLFYNLIGNALKFTKPDTLPQVLINSRQISAEEAAQHIHKPFPFSRYYRISISDNGIGFEPEYTEQIFEVFKRLHGRDIYPGSGIGLALCRRIVTNHNGCLYAESEPGTGTTFHIILPDKQTEKAP